MAHRREQPVEARMVASAEFTSALGAGALGPRTMVVGNDGEVGDEALGAYINGLYGTELLRAEEEVDLARQIEAGLVAGKVLGLINRKTRAQTEAEILDSENPDAPDALEYLQKMADRPELKCWQGRRDLKRVQHEGEAAKLRFIMCNLRLVVARAKRYVGHSDLKLADLIQEGNDGLVAGVEKFDFTKGYKFSTYGTWWVRQAITRAIDEIGYLVRKPADKSQIVRKMQGVRRGFMAENGEEPTVDELAAAMDVPREAILQWMEWESRSVSLDLPVGNTKERILGDIVDVGEPTPEQIVLAQLDREGLHDLLFQLEVEEPQLATVLRLRFGLEDGQEYSPSRTASLMQVSRQQAKQLEERALRRLRALAEMQRTFAA